MTAHWKQNMAHQWFRSGDTCSLSTVTTDALSLSPCFVLWAMTAARRPVSVPLAGPQLWHWWDTAAQMFTWLKPRRRGDGRKERRTRLTGHDPSDEHTHVGAQRAGPEQTQGAVSLPGGADNKTTKVRKSSDGNKKMTAAPIWYSRGIPLQQLMQPSTVFDLQIILMFSMRTSLPGSSWLQDIPTLPHFYDKLTPKKDICSYNLFWVILWTFYEWNALSSFIKVKLCCKNKRKKGTIEPLANKVHGTKNISFDGCECHRQEQW